MAAAASCSSKLCYRPVAFSTTTARWLSTFVSSPLLLPPKVIFSNHHLLVVNKPPGWRSIPLDSKDYTSRRDGEKCLLTYLKNKGLGGGSSNDYLKPVHRLDQPCSGLTVFAKNSKAASRIQKAWAKRQVQKEYYCVVETDILESMIERAVPWEQFHAKHNENENVKQKQPIEWGDGEWQDKNSVYVLSGILSKRPDGKGSVRVKRLPDSAKTSEKNPSDDSLAQERPRGSVCHLEFRHIASVSNKIAFDDDNPSTSRQHHLLAVRTVTGMRHQIRAMLSGIGKCPIVGDLRYGGSAALPDQSVALHARALYMPTVKLGGTDLTAAPFVAPIPTTWKKYFGIRERDLQNNH